MFHVALLAAVLAVPATSAAPSQTQRCLAAMDGGVYHGDPADRAAVKADVAACLNAAVEVRETHVGVEGAPAKLFLIGRLFDRAATLSYMGLGDAPGARRAVRTANLYFRVTAGLNAAGDDVATAARANVELTQIQLRTLDTDIAASAYPHATAPKLRPAVVALHAKSTDRNAR